MTNIIQLLAPSSLIKYKLINIPITGSSEKLCLKLRMLIVNHVPQNTSTKEWSAKNPPSPKEIHASTVGRTRVIIQTTPTANAKPTKYLTFMYGTRNFDFLESPVLSMYRTPPQTNINAKKVPTEVKSTKKSILKKSAGTATTIPVTMVAKEGVLYLG